MLDDLESKADIVRETDRLLKKAHAYGRFPTPVGDIISAAKLKEAKHDLFDQDVLSGLSTHLKLAIERLQTRVQAALDRREKTIYISNRDTNQGAIAFKKLHEVTHDILPWQSALGYADDGLSLSSATRILFEQEANQGGAELLFQRETFSRISRDYAFGFPTIVLLSQKFGSSIHAAFRREVETTSIEACGLVLKPQDSDPPGEISRQETFASPAWMGKFKNPNHWPTRLTLEKCPFMEQVVTALIDKSVSHSGEIALTDLNGNSATVSVNTFFNSYHVFVLIWRKPKHKGLLPKRKVRIAA